jgi:hypothetical protein
VDVATEEIFMKDKEMQFTYGDDTQLFNIIRYIISYYKHLYLYLHMQVCLCICI